MDATRKKTSLRKQKEQAQRREAILNSAREAFFDKGFMAATIEDIADGCELAKGTIYLYFKSKEDLYICLVIEGLGLLKRDLGKIRELDLPADLLLGEMLRLYHVFYEKNPKYFRIMFLSSQPDVRERVKEELLKECLACAAECIQILNEVILRGCEEGIFRKANSWTFAIVLWTMVNGIIMQYEQDPFYRGDILKVSLGEMLQEGLDLALNGLRLKRPEEVSG
ncbi:MAG: TetR/AcrR family transcriptional regulator [Syntrophobacteraceae bacterium]|nr:TetR/AcrR family transcriptional regulator [Syntrophobacteraceae bacterium]